MGTAMETTGSGTARAIGVLVTETGIAGAPLLPMFIFVTTIFGADGRLRDVLPFVLFYSFLKTGSYAIQAFGKVNNPFRLAQLSALVYAVGSVFTVFGPLQRWCFDVGAILIGFGLSVFVPMYKTVKDVLRDEHRFPYHMETPGYLIMVVLVIVTLLAARHIEQVILVVYCAMSLVSIASIHGIVRGSGQLDAPLFKPAGRRWYYICSSVMLLALVFFIRLFKQTADLRSALAIGVVSTAIISVNVVPGLIRGERARLEQFHEFFYGEAIVILILYNVFYFTCLGEQTKVFLAFGCIFVGMAFAQMLGRGLVFAHPDLQISNFLLIAIMLASFLLFSPVLYFPALVVLGFLICLGFMRMAYVYRTWRSYPQYGQRMAAQWAKNLGTIVGQWILLAVIIGASFVYFHSGNRALMPYVDHLAQPDAVKVFYATKIVCIGVLWLQVLFFAIRELVNGTMVRHAHTPRAQVPPDDLVNVLQ